MKGYPKPCVTFITAGPADTLVVGGNARLLWLACSALCCGFVACHRCNHEIRIACELATLTLRDVRFVSVWGPRGVGKSSSALNVVQYVVTLLWHICCRCVNVWVASAWGGRAKYVSCPSVRCPVLYSLSVVICRVYTTTATLDLRCFFT